MKLKFIRWLDVLMILAGIYIGGKRILINVSNHPSSSWSDEQKFGWDKIIDIPFPEIDPSMEMSDIHNLANKVYGQIEEICKNKSPGDYIGVMLQGEYTFCYVLFLKLISLVDIYVPVSRRNVVENPDGSKTVKFKFDGWRRVKGRPIGIEIEQTKGVK